MRFKTAKAPCNQIPKYQKKSQREFIESIVTKIRCGQMPQHLYSIEKLLTPKGAHILLCLPTTAFDQSQ